jgi:hypothetical protein
METALGQDADQLSLVRHLSWPSSASLTQVTALYLGIAMTVAALLTALAYVYPGP